MRVRWLSDWIESLWSTSCRKKRRIITHFVEFWNKEHFIQFCFFAKEQRNWTILMFNFQLDLGPISITQEMFLVTNLQIIHFLSLINQFKFWFWIPFICMTENLLIIFLEQKKIGEKQQWWDLEEKERVILKGVILFEILVNCALFSSFSWRGLK